MNMETNYFFLPLACIGEMILVIGVPLRLDIPTSCLCTALYAVH